MLGALMQDLEGLVALELGNLRQGLLNELIGIQQVRPSRVYACCVPASAPSSGRGSAARVAPTSDVSPREQDHTAA